MGCGASSQAHATGHDTGKVVIGSTPTQKQPYKQQDSGEPLKSARAAPEGKGSQPVSANGAPEAANDKIISSALSEAPDIAPLSEHQGAPMPANESERVAALKSLNVLDSENEERFDSITKLVSSIFKVPICLVSLVDTNRQWFKSACGLSTKSTPRSQAFCAWTLLPDNPEVLIVENAMEDDRFRHNPLVTNDPYIRFYAGSPLVSTSGLRLGTLCVIDRIPRKFDEFDCRTLVNFAELVVREIERDQLAKSQLHMAATLFEENNRLMRAIESLQEGLILANLSQAAWPIMFCNQAWTDLSDLTKFETEGRSFWEIFELVDKRMAPAAYADAIASNTCFAVQAVFTKPTGERITCDIRLKPAEEDMDVNAQTVQPPSSVNGGKMAIDPEERYYFATIVPIEIEPSNAEAMTSANPGTVALNSNMTSTVGGLSSVVGGVAGGALALQTTDPFTDVRLGRLMGKGAFGRVYKGLWDGAPVAVKVLEHKMHINPLDPASASAIANPVLEAILSVNISHPNLVHSFKYACRKAASNAPGAEEGGDANAVQMDMAAGQDILYETWIIQEFCDMGSLQDACDKGVFVGAGGAPLMDAILSTAREIAGALTHLHSRRLLHGDLTANNVLLTCKNRNKRGFVAKVADFGLSRVMVDNDDNVQTQNFGTVSYMPEELLVQGKLTSKTDVYSFGVLMWQLFNCLRPWAGMNHAQVINQVVVKKAKLTFPPHCPEAFRDLAERCMRPDPEERPNFADVLETLIDLESAVLALQKEVADKMAEN